MTNNIKIFSTLIAVSCILIVGIVVRYTGAADVTATAEIQNEAPAVDTINFATTAYGTDDLTSSGILPNIGTTRTIHINGQITDNNGENDIVTSTVTVVFHRTSKTNTCTTDNNDCYSITSCATNIASGDDTQISYNCEVPIQYYIDATDSSSTFLDDSWTAFVRVEDAASSPATREATIEVNSLLALNLPDNIDYSTRSLGEVSSSTTNIETILTQRGNTKADVQVKGAIMSCTILGTLAINTQAWSLTDVGHASGAVLTDTLVATERNINLRTDDGSELVASLYWNIAIPATGVKGTCIGSNTIAIVAQGNEEAALIDGRLQNVRYTTSSRTGFTGTTGNFIIEEGETTTFSIGAVTLGSIAYDDIPADRLIFLQDLLGLARTNTSDAGLIKRAQFLQSLATETSLTGATVLSIPASAHESLNASINFSTINDSALQTEIQKVHVGKTLRTTAEAAEHVNDTLAAEGVLSSYTVSTSQGANSTITPSSRTVAHGNITTFTVTPDSGYSFSASGCGGSLTGNTYTTGVITANCTVTTTATALFTCGASTIQYDGGPYNAAGTTKDYSGYYRTVSIGTQCFMKDNLNVGVMLASGATNPTNDATIQKWCYDNSTTNCNNEGGLYSWDETMSWTETAGTQGICPAGWHVPTDNEYKTLEVFLGMTQGQADATGWRGTDQGTKLKVGGSSGFEARLSGHRSTDGSFYGLTSDAVLWSSSVSGSDAWSRYLYSGYVTVYRSTDGQAGGFSVRCIRD